MNIYLIRHGKTEASDQGVYCGITDSAISDKGYNELKAKKDENIYPLKQSVDFFGVSQRSRTKETLKALYGDVPFTEFSQLNEYDFGKYEMKKHEDLVGDIEYQNWISNYQTIAPPQGKSPVEFYSQAMRLLEQIYKQCDSNPKRNAVLVTHALLIDGIINRIFSTKALSYVPECGEGYHIQVAFNEYGEINFSRCKLIGEITTNASQEFKGNVSGITKTKKQLTILHSNDIHNDLFFKADQDFVLHGGISMLANYVQHTRETTPNSIYCISGDILEKDIWDSEYKGSNTIDIINAVNPNIISLGNHELDYGLEHTLIFKECITSKLLNANIIVEKFQKNLFTPSCVVTVGDVKVLFIGLISREIFKRVTTNVFCNNVLEYKENLDAIKDELEKYKDEDIDATILMTHIGIDLDIELAKSIPPEYNIDIILGGHSHTLMDEPVVINGIKIVQVGWGTKNIGRFDIEFDTQTKTISKCDWQRVPITSENCGFSAKLDELADRKIETKKEKNLVRTLCSFEKILNNESKLYETELGDVIADAFLHTHKTDMVIIQSSSIKKNYCPQVLKEQFLYEMYPYDDAFYSVGLTGSAIKAMFDFLFMKKENETIMGGTFQYSKGFYLEVDGNGGKINDQKKKTCDVKKIMINGEELIDDIVYQVGVTGDCLKNFKRYFNSDVLSTDLNVVTVSLSTYHDLARYFLSHKTPIKIEGQGRFKLYNFEV